MKEQILFLIMTFFIISSTIAQSRKWEPMTERSDGCHALVDVQLERRVSSYDANIYKVRAILTIAQTTFPVEINIKGNKQKSWDRVTIPISGNKIVEFDGEYNKTEITNVDYQLERRKFIGLELKYLRGKERYAKCGEMSNEVSQRDKAKGIRIQREEKKRDTDKKEITENKNNTRPSTLGKENEAYVNSNPADKLPSENIYAKKQREAREAAERKRKREKEEMQDFNKFKQSQARQENSMKKAGDEVMSSIDAAFAQTNTKLARASARNRDYMAKQKAETAERKRQLKIREEERIRKNQAEERERKRKKAIREEEERIKSNQHYYYGQINDQKMPLVVSQSEVFFFIVLAKNYATDNNKEVQFAPFSLKTNNSNQLPYKNKVIADFIKKNNIRTPLLQGPYTSQKQQLSAINKLKSQAIEFKITVSQDIIYTYDQGVIKAKTGNKDTDFWGNKKTKTPKKQTNKNDTDFWGNKKKQ